MSALAGGFAAVAGDRSGEVCEKGGLLGRVCLSELYCIDT